MPTVIHELADAFLRRKQALAERGQAKTKLAGSDYFMPKSAKQDLSNRLSVFEQGGLPGLFGIDKEAIGNVAEQGAGLAKSVARGVPQMATGLVDLAAMPFEAAGVLEPGQAVGSTKWLESKGYLPPPQEGFINQTVEGLAGALDPSTMAAHALPAIGMLGKTVWHGSPHSFEKFDLSKIGTGEGAQAYGHGLYLAEARPVAEEYKQALSNPEVVLKSGERISNPAVGSNEDVAKAWLEEQFLKGSETPFDDAIARLNKLKRAANNPKQFEGAADILNQWKNEGATVDLGGSLYKVDLPDEQIAKMLDWDKPFAEQPQNVQDAITKYWKENRVYGDPTKLTGEGIYGSIQGHVLGNRGSDIANRSASQEAASMDLNYAGIPGIQYLDQASRGAGEGTRNYVVFSDEIPKILERNGTSVFEFPKD